MASVEEVVEVVVEEVVEDEEARDSVAPGQTARGTRLSAVSMASASVLPTGHNSLSSETTF